MASLYDVSSEAQNDLFEIWRRIAEDSIDLADRIDNEFHELTASLASGDAPARARPQRPDSEACPVFSALLVHGGLSANEADSYHGRFAWQPRRKAHFEGTALRADLHPATF